MCTTFAAVFGNGSVRDLPSGVDEYLRLRAVEQGAGDASVVAEVNEEVPAGKVKLGGGQRREIAKKVASIERRLTKRRSEAEQLHVKMAENSSDPETLLTTTAQLRELDTTIASLEEEWLVLAEQLAQ